MRSLTPLNSGYIIFRKLCRVFLEKILKKYLKLSELGTHIVKMTYFCIFNDRYIEFDKTVSNLYSLDSRFFEKYFEYKFIHSHSINL